MFLVNNRKQKKLGLITVPTKHLVFPFYEWNKNHILNIFYLIKSSVGLMLYFQYTIHYHYDHQLCEMRKRGKLGF